MNEPLTYTGCLRALGFLLFLTLALPITVLCQDTTRFYEFTPGWRTWNIEELGSGDYSVIGSTGVTFDDRDMIFMQYDEEGQFIDEFNYQQQVEDGHSRQVRLETCRLRLNDGVLIVGEQLDNESAGTDQYGYIVKMTPDLTDTLWTKTIEVLSDSENDSISITSSRGIIESDDGFFVSGIFITDDYKRHTYIRKYDFSGNEVWTQIFDVPDGYPCSGSQGWAFPEQTILTPDNGLILLLTRFFTSGSHQLVSGEVKKLNSFGIEEWSLIIENDTTWSNLGRIADMQDGTYMLSWGDAELRSPCPFSNGSNLESSLNITKFDIEGQHLWTRHYEDEEHWIFEEERHFLGHSAFRTDDGNAIFVTLDAFFSSKVIKMNPEGDIIWARDITRPPWLEGQVQEPGTLEHTWLFGAWETSDHGIVCAGQYYNGGSDIYPTGIQTGIIVKLDPFGCLEAGCDSLDVSLAEYDLIQIDLYPNPVKETVIFNISDAGKYRLLIHNNQGQSILEESHFLSTSSFSIDVSNLSSGLYLVSLIGDNKIYTGRFIKE